MHHLKNVYFFPMRLRNNVRWGKLQKKHEIFTLDTIHLKSCNTSENVCPIWKSIFLKLIHSSTVASNLGLLMQDTDSKQFCYLWRSRRN